MERINLNREDIMNGVDACRKYNIDASNLSKRFNDFPEGTIRKFGRNFVVTKEGMEFISKIIQPRKKKNN